MDTLKDFKELVEKYLHQEGHSQAYLANKLHYSPDRLNKWLLGVNKIPYDVIGQICNALNLSESQQVEIYAVAGYPLPKWVEDMLSMTESNTAKEAEDEFGFDPSIIGVYEGESQEQRSINNKDELIPGTENIERFSIDIVKDWVRITGRSFHKMARKRVSTWHGRLWKVENGNTLYFAIELDTGNREIGTLMLTCENGEMEGWFYSGRDYQRFVYEFWAKKVDSPP